MVWEIVIRQENKRVPVGKNEGIMLFINTLDIGVYKYKRVYLNFFSHLLIGESFIYSVTTGYVRTACLDYDPPVPTSCFPSYPTAHHLPIFKSPPPSVFYNPLGSISPACWSVDWTCWLHFGQVTTAALGSWVQRQRCAQKTSRHSSPCSNAHLLSAPSLRCSLCTVVVWKTDVDV